MPTPLPRPEEKRAYVQKMFTAISDRYDLLNSLISLNLDSPWRRRMVRACEVQGADRVLDIGTGSGVSAFELSRALSPAGLVVGADFSHGMLEVAIKKMHAPCSFVNADALELPFPDASFDAITSAFVLRNLVDIQKGFEEMCRVARPGGRVVALEICRPDNLLLKALFKIYFYGWVPLLGGLLSSFNAYTYLPNSLTNVPIKSDLTALMTAAGLKNARYDLLAGGMAAVYVGVKS